MNPQNNSLPTERVEEAAKQKINAQIEASKLLIGELEESKKNAEDKRESDFYSKRIFIEKSYLRGLEFSLSAMLEFAQHSHTEGLQKPSAAEAFLIREFDTNQWYWCKCENCGWEDSSEFAEGGHAIGQSGDFSDPMCPICGSLKIDGDNVVQVPESYTGVHKVKIPLDVLIQPYQKTVKLLEEEIDRLRFAQPSAPIQQQKTITEEEIEAMAEKPLKQCMIGRDGECNHPKCPVSDEDERNGKYCTLPLYDYRQ